MRKVGMMKPETEEQTVTVGILDAKQLAKAVKAVGLAASKDEARPALTQILLEVTDTSADLVATDSYRLHRYALDWTWIQGGSVRVMFYPEDLAEFVASLDPFEQLTITPFGLSRWTGQTLGQVVEGDYPDWRKLCEPIAVAGCVDVAVADIVGIAKACAAFAKTEKLPARTVRLAKHGKMGLRASWKGVDLQDAQWTLQDATVTGEMKPVSLNPKYLGDAVRASGAERVEMCFSEGPTKPAVVRAGAYSALVMPVRTEES